MHTNQLKIIGCSGHGKVVIDALLLCNYDMQISLCDDNRALLGAVIAGLLIDSTTDSLSNFTGFLHVAIGDNRVRQSILKRLSTETNLFTVIHPSAVISKTASIGRGSFIAAQAILGPETHIGEGSIINHSAVVDHEVTVGAYSHIAPHSTLGGNVTVGQRVLIGAGAVVLPGISVGDGAVIAAGAVVIKDVKENTLVKGVPAV